MKEVPIFHVYEVYHIQGMLLKSHMCTHLFVCVFMLGPKIFAINLTMLFGFEFLFNFNTTCQTCLRLLLIFSLSNLPIWIVQIIEIKNHPFYVKNLHFGPYHVILCTMFMDIINYNMNSNAIPKKMKSFTFATW
jgi:hypothetical protein